MKFSEIMIAAVSVWIIQPGCYAPTLTYSDERPTPVHADVPSWVQRGKEYSFSFISAPDTTCYAAISFWNVDGKWDNEELPIVIADQIGVCQWVWEVPQNANDGEAEFRGYAELNTKYEYVFPANFCIEKCP